QIPDHANPAIATDLHLITADPKTLQVGMICNKSGIPALDAAPFRSNIAANWRQCMSEPKPPSFVSAQMVAERAGVSRSAVSRTFTDGASVSEATRAKVLEAAGALGYHVNHLARGLRERSNIVCLVVADI